MLTLIFMAISLIMILGGGVPILAHYTAVNDFISSKQSYAAAQSGADDAWYRLKNGKTLNSPVYLNLGTGSSTITITTTGNYKKVNVASAQNNFLHSLQVDLVLGTGVSFHYGIQSGDGGFVLQNSSSVTGNIFSNGAVTGSGNTIAGDVISAGSGGLISGITATGTAYAHTIQNSSIGKDAYYQVISGSTASGAACTGNTHCHPNTPDQSTAPLPISDSQIAQWENDAAAGSTATCTSGSYSITSPTSIGPLKVPCDLSIKNTTVTVTGPVWVTGNIDVKGSTVVMSSGLSSNNVPVIADNASNPSGSDIITTDTSTQFYAAGCPSACVPGAFVFLISQNNSGQTGGSTNAISLGQSSSGVIAYAAHGQVTIGQSVNLKEVTAYKIILVNTANVTYDTGLGSSLFEAGPGGGYSILDWFEY